MPPPVETPPSGTPPSGTPPSGTPPSGTPPADQKAAEWHPWTIGLSAPLALVVSLLLLLADGLAGVLNNLGGPASARTWLGVAAIGHGVLAAASAVLLGVGLWKPAQRKVAVVAAWAIIPVGIGWFLVCGRLAAG